MLGVFSDLADFPAGFLETGREFPGGGKNIHHIHQIVVSA
jgi:hypothetical protein